MKKWVCFIYGFVVSFFLSMPSGQARQSEWKARCSTEEQGNQRCSVWVTNDQLHVRYRLGGKTQSIARERIRKWDVARSRQDSNYVSLTPFSFQDSSQDSPLRPQSSMQSLNPKEPLDVNGSSPNQAWLALQDSGTRQEVKLGLQYRELGGSARYMVITLQEDEASSLQLWLKTMSGDNEEHD
jgi:hypothetical protein